MESHRHSDDELNSLSDRRLYEARTAFNFAFHLATSTPFTSNHPRVGYLRRIPLS